MTLTDGPATANPTSRAGLWLGGGAVLCWSFASALIFLGARDLGPWAFVALASLLGGTVQLFAWRWHRGGFRTALRLPWRLWAVSVPCFVAYGLVWPAALASATPREVYGVNLINYLWPVLTVLLGSWWVPGARLTPRTLGASGLALAGLACANLAHLQALLAPAGPAGATAPLRLLPYGLAGAAALSWAVYSASLARWRYWAGGYATSPLGFLFTGLVAAGVSAGSDTSVADASARGLWLTLAYGVGPLAAGYLLWEIALGRTRIEALGLLGTVTPVLSTLVLCVVLQTWPGLEVVAGAVLVSAGVLLSVRR